MQTRILTRFTTFIVFVFTCCLTMTVVANERGLAPQLTPDAWKLLSDAEAIAQGFTPTTTQTLELEPRPKIEKRALVKLPNSRVKVKFVDDLKIRLDVHNKPYSRAQRPESVGAICESLGVTLVPTISRSQDDIDALIHKAELVSRKQMPDVGGIYWVTGDSTAVDVAAELFWTMEEVEWVIYKPVFSKMPKGAPKPDFSVPEHTTPIQTVTPQPPAETNVGACQFTKNECLEDMGQWACVKEGGTFLGPNSICFKDQDDIYGDDRSALLPNTAECCLLTGCVKVVNEAACNLANGVLISVVVAPAVACATNTVCPPGVGPALAAYSTCGVIGTPVTLLTGDCYIDQTVILQTSRAAPVTGAPLGFPVGCADTTGLTPGGVLGGPAAGDLVVSTGIDLTQASNVFAASTCCATISADVPACATGPWNALCASYANAYAVLGNGTCLRSIANPVVPPNNCLAPLGPVTNPGAVQKRINMATVGTADSGIQISNPTGNGGANVLIQMQIVEVPALVANGCGDGDCFLQLLNDGVITPAFPAGIPLIGGNLNALLGIINGIGLGYAGVLEGLPAAGATVLDTALNPTGLITIFNNGFAVPSIPQSISTIPIRFAAGCSGPSGTPTFDRTATPGLTPDYAGLGLLTWMTPDFTPWFGNGVQPPQNLALPCLPIAGSFLPLYAQATMTADEIFHVTQLLPWPMNGANTQGTVAGIASGTTPIPQFSAASSAAADGTGGIGWYGGDGGVDLFPDAPAPGGFGGEEVFKGAYGYGLKWAADGVGTVGPSGAVINGAFGNGVKIAVLDWSAHLQQRAILDEFGATVNLGGIHEEFRANGLATNTLDALGNTVPTASTVMLEGPATGHNVLSLNFDENLPFGYSADHGTAVLGVIGANWSTTSPLPGAAAYPPTLTTRLTGIAGVTPNVGVLGMAPDATLMFFPLSTETAPDREEQAWFNAIESLDAGDVICAAYQLVAVDAPRPNLNYWEDTASYLQLANGLGICSVIKAGDQGLDLAGIALPNGDQNVIVATAVTPGTSTASAVPSPPAAQSNTANPPTAKRYCDSVRASNFCLTSPQTYSAVSASGWGMGVVTCGKGFRRDNYLGYNTISYPNSAPPSPYASPASDPHVVHAQAYTNNFGFTDAAAAQVAGAVAISQGFSRQIFGIPMGPQVCRQLIAGGKYAGRARDGTPILEPAPFITTEQGVDSSCETTPNTLDWDFCLVPGAGNLTGNLNNPRNAMVNAILNPIFDTPNIDTTMLIRGSLLFGNRFSLSAIDGNLLGALPVRTKAHQPYAVPPAVPGGPVRYLGNGLVTDLFLAGQLQDSLPMNNQLTVDVTLFPTQQSTMFIRLEMLDARTGRWRQAAATTTLPLNSTDATFTVERASAFINSADGYFMRLITIDVNSPHDEGPTAVYPVFYDQVRITSGMIQN